MKRTLIFFEILCMIFFLLFSSADKRTQFLTSLAGPGMLSLVKQASAKATAFEDFSTDTTAGLPVEEPPRIALTFDDGPYAPVGNRIMDCAEQYGGRVTFYVVGNRVNSYKSEIQRMYANGHEIGNHTQDHKYLQKLGAQEIRQQVEACNQAVAAITGEAPKTVRLPGGGKNSTVLANISQPIVLWNVDTLDWKTRNAASSVQTVLNQVKDGSVVLMHELYNASGDAAVTIIPALVERGYQLVTVSELAQFRGGLAGGTVYYSFHK